MGTTTKLHFQQGDDVNYPALMTDSVGDPIDLTGAVFSGDIRSSIDGPVVASFTFTDVDLANGQYSFALTSAETSQLPMERNKPQASLPFDIQYVQGGITKTTITGYCIVKKEMTSG